MVCMQGTCPPGLQVARCSLSEPTLAGAQLALQGQLGRDAPPLPDSPLGG
eukprot:NODE_2626_length_1074_cov_11.799024_g2187_i0.p8 GENE.NODE_2626_length_1074_cov_11.799024_g2187_i0~~NODE_2626_length_1074_cov_11.799024_g2187_i0.p8  ORF type:complete len:50 (-),score=3.19 NODE_2626_length_1074_cov_11.799024_g2187_i0:494-643(-)